MQRNKWDKALDVFPKAESADATTAFMVKSKIIQCHQALGQLEERDDAIRALKDLYEDGKVPDEKFCREEIHTEQGMIFVFEYYKFSGDFGKFVYQMVWEPSAPKDPNLKHMVTLGSYDMTNQIDWELGMPRDLRMYHADLYKPNGDHVTLGMFRNSEIPSYDAVREIMLNGMLGKGKGQSRFTPPQK